MKYYVIAGELSGDKHAALLIRHIKQYDRQAEFRGFGGDNLKAEGVTIVKHINDLAFMGFAEVVAHLPQVLSNISFCKKDILAYKPDCMIFIDYPGFNLRIANFTYQQKIKNFYYISPQVWAWKKGRIKKMQKILDKLYVILPFEKPFYKKHNMEVEYYGNPLLDEISIFKTSENNKENFLKEYSLGNKPIVAILPGSRKQEIKKMLPVQTSIADKYPQFDFVIACVDSFDEEYYKQYIQSKNVKLIFNKTYDILNVAHCGLITSGTATLETALFDVPQCVCYKTSRISYIIGKYVAKIKYISLVNLILNHGVVKELLQSLWNTDDLEKEFRKIAFDESYRHNMKNDYSVLRSQLGNAGASDMTAKSIVKHLTNN
ncbi:MAG: lipid-A-disaccharide synthase [Bacteroidales bacterium]|nr:lipid-A-disaccharide synthase [Bacteroidales bacterium]